MTRFSGKFPSGFRFRVFNPKAPGRETNDFMPGRNRSDCIDFFSIAGKKLRIGGGNIR
jgi:hypothetical protein